VLVQLLMLLQQLRPATQSQQTWQAQPQSVLLPPLQGLLSKDS